MRARMAVAVAAVLLVAASTASAQSEAFFSVGVGGRLFATPASELTGTTKVTPLVRIRRGAGWSPDLRLDWYAVTTSDEVHVNVRPVLLGLSRTWERNRISLGISAGAGYAFASVDGPLRVNAWSSKGSVAAGSALTAWYDLSKDFGLRTSVGYVFTRPSLRQPGLISRELKAESFVLNVGIAYGLF